MEAAAEAVHDAASSMYDTDEGLAELRAALQDKIERENGLHGSGPPAFCCTSMFCWPCSAQPI